MFEQLGVLFGAGGRHVAEFVPNILTENNDLARRYGVVLTNVDHREEIVRVRRERVERFVAGEEKRDLADHNRINHSDSAHSVNYGLDGSPDCLPARRVGVVEEVIYNVIGKEVRREITLGIAVDQKHGLT